VLLGVVGAFYIGKLPPALPALRAEFALTLTQSGWIVSVFNTLGLLASIFMGLATARLGPWRQCVLGLALLVLGGVWGADAGSAVQLLWSRALEGVGFLCLAVAAPGLIMLATQPDDRRRAFSLWGAYMPIGTAMGLLLAPTVMAAQGWRALWLVDAVFAALALVLLLRMRHEFGANALATKSHSVTKSGSFAQVWRSARGPLHKAGPWWIALAFGCYAMNFYAIMVWLPTFLMGERHLPLAQASALTALMVAANIPGNLMGGWLMQRGVSRGTNVVLAAAITALTCLVIFSPALSDAVRYAGCIAFSLCVGILPGSVMSAAQTHAHSPQEAGMVQGMINQGSNIGQFVSPFLVTAVVGAAMAWERMLVMLLVSAAVIAAMGLVIRRIEQRPSP
jgi:cyanate permease